ncbi:MAG: hypothetical protein GVY19_05745 [Bacteroidetes bacterium]|jgi:hypothetical protein|nr:hypothetical protein [Bacteroidota bacterium]
MKKTSLFITALTGLLIMFASCEKEITTSVLVVDESKTAILKLYVRADMDTTAGMEEVPDSTQFILTISKNDLNSSFAGDGYWTKNVYTSQGVLETEVPASYDGVDINVDAVAFEHEYVVNDSTTELRVYEYNNVWNIETGSNNVELINMNSTLIETIVE